MQLVSMICMEAAAAAADNKQRKCPTKLDLSAPLLSTRTRRWILPSSTTDDIPPTAELDDGTSNRIPFSWEETAGKPKETREEQARDGIGPVPGLPPGRTYGGHSGRDCDSYYEKSVDSTAGNRELLQYSDALNVFSSSDEESSSCDEGEDFEPGDFIFMRFLKDAEALATERLISGRDSGGRIGRPGESCFARALGVGQLLYEHPCCGKACGRDILLPWRMKVEPLCGGAKDSAVVVASSRGKETLIDRHY